MPELNVHLHDFNSNRTCGADKIYDIDTLHKQSIATRMKTSLMGTATLRSNAVQRPDPKPLQGAPRQYDTDTGPALSIAKSVAVTPQVYSSIRSGQARIAEEKKTAAFHTYDANYDTQMNDMGRRVERSPIVFSSMKSKQSRSITLPFGKDSPDTEYNTDTGSKASLLTCVREDKSSHGKFLTGTMRPMTRGFVLGKEVKIKRDNPSPDYNINTLHKKDIYTSVVNSPVKYAAVLKSKSNPTKTSEKHQILSKAAGGIYDTDRGHQISMAKAVDSSSVCYSAMGSKVSRFSGVSETAQSQVERRREQGRLAIAELKGSSRKKVLQQSKSTGNLPSRMNYGKKIIPRFEKPPRPMYDTNLGPGSFENTDPDSMQTRLQLVMEKETRMQKARLACEFQRRFEVKEVPKPKPVVIRDDPPRISTQSTKSFKFSTTKRFDERFDTTKFLGSTDAALRMDKKSWEPPGRTIDATLQRLDLSKTNERPEAVQKSNRCYTASFKSKQPRLADLQSVSAFSKWNPAVSAEIGPGKYDTADRSEEIQRPSTSFVALGRK